ncbi:hypothetical protein FQN60_011495 [Etheostoma spectabile]|uniref:Uncharacterized protein n=1 Tax=Etheostoma spectabile TaxID=54343 RepID=A0A5J5CCB8_9PERO|nr:hypothetical protein FQN60_011495 [Etheostoma spectabile]
MRKCEPVSQNANIPTITETLMSPHLVSLSITECSFNCASCGECFQGITPNHKDFKLTFSVFVVLADFMNIHRKKTNLSSNKTKSSRSKFLG